MNNLYLTKFADQLKQIIKLNEIKEKMKVKNMLLVKRLSEKIILSN